MADRARKAEERAVARLLGGRRYPANSGGRVDVESAHVLAQVKHVKRLALAKMGRLALDIDELAAAKGKAGVLTIKRRAGFGYQTPRLIVMTEGAYQRLARLVAAHGTGAAFQEPADAESPDDTQAEVFV